MRDLPPRILVAAGVSILAVVVLVVLGLRGGGDDDTSRSSTTTTDAPAPTPSAGPPTSIVLRPDWYRKGSSRYSDRRPATTAPTVVTSTSTSMTTTVPGPTSGAG